MNINRDYFWFRLFKTRGIGPKLLVSVAKILEAENLNPEMLPRSQSELLVQSPKLAKILNGKIQAEDREKVITAYEQLKKEKLIFFTPDTQIFRHTSVKSRRFCLLKDSKNAFCPIVSQLLVLGTYRIKEIV